MKLKFKMLLTGLTLAAAALNAAQSPTPVVTRSIAPSQIYYSGSAQTPNTATVTLTVTTTGDTIVVGAPLDILFVIDTSSTMGARSDPGSRISGVYNAMINFLNSSIGVNDRIACRVFAGNDRLFFGFRSLATDPGFTATKNLLTQYLQAGGDGTAIYNAAYNAVQYMVQNKRPTATPVIVYLSDGGINNSYTAPPIRTASEFANYVRTFPVGTRPIIYTISIVSIADSISLKTLAGVTFGKYTHSPTANGLTNIFDGIAQEFKTTAGIEINAATTPMLIDVLGANIHYIQGSFNGTAGNLDVAANQFSIDSAGALDQLKFSIPLIKLNDTVTITYRISAYLTTPSSSPTQMPTTTLGGATYSRLRYYRADSVIVEKPFTSDNIVNVLSEITGVRLSTSATALTAAVDQSVTYGTIAKGTLPVTLYTLAEATASGNSHSYENVSATWNFSPAQAWINNGTTVLNNASGTQQTLTLIAGPGSGFPNGPYNLTVTYNTNFHDTVVYSGSYSATTLEGKSIRVTYASTPVKAGDPLTFTVQVIDTLGNIVTNQALLPDSMSVTVTHRSVVNGDTVEVTETALIPLTFDNTGTFNGTFTAFALGANTLNFTTNLPGKTPSDPVRPVAGSVTRTTIPADPAVIRVVPYPDSAGFNGTTVLVVGGADSLNQQTYQVIITDAFGNPITDPAVLSAITWNGSGVVDGSDVVYNPATQRFTYSGKNETFPGSGQLTFHLNNLTTGVNIIIYTPVPVSFISTHEWYPEPGIWSDLNNPLSAKYVNNTVLGLADADEITTYANIAAAGYPSYLDGFLDYLDLQFPQGGGLALDAACISRIEYAQSGLSRGWTLQAIVPLDNLAPDKHEAYRIWLQPNWQKIQTSLDTAIMETGFLPQLVFDNNKVKALNGNRVFIGQGTFNPSDPLFETPAALTRDSASPIIARFLLDNNVCTHETSSVDIEFSEAVDLADDQSLQIGGLALLETAFTRRNGGPEISSLNDGSLAGISATDSGYLLLIMLGREGDFIQNKTEIRLNVAADPSQRVQDFAGNHVSGRPNRWVSLDAKGGENPGLCNQFAPTSVDRYESSNYSWTIDPLDGQPAPLFPWWGIVLTNPYNSGVYRDDKRRPPNPVMSIYVFDLFGNVVATPFTNQSLRTDFDAELLYKGTGSDTLYSSTASIGLPELTNCRSGTYHNCLPVWNCINAKGRLVAPGGYLIKMVVEDGVNPPIFTNHKLIVTSKQRIASAP